VAWETGDKESGGQQRCFSLTINQHQPDLSAQKLTSEQAEYLPSCKKTQIQNIKIRRVGWLTH